MKPLNDYAKYLALSDRLPDAITRTLKVDPIYFTPLFYNDFEDLPDVGYVDFFKNYNWVILSKRGMASRTGRKVHKVIVGQLFRMYMNNPKFKDFVDNLDDKVYYVELRDDGYKIHFVSNGKRFLKPDEWDVRDPDSVSQYELVEPDSMTADFLFRTSRYFNCVAMFLSYDKPINGKYVAQNLYGGLIRHMRADTLGMQVYDIMYYYGDTNIDKIKSVLFNVYGVDASVDDIKRAYLDYMKQVW